MSIFRSYNNEVCKEENGIITSGSISEGKRGTTPTGHLEDIPSQDDHQTRTGGDLEGGSLSIVPSRTSTQ